MKSIIILDKIHEIDTHIKLRRTGNMKEFAQQMRVSEQQLSDYFTIIKALGGNICFNEKRNSFDYDTHKLSKRKINRIKKQATTV